MTHLPDEIEAKFYPINVEEMRKSLNAIGAKCSSPMRLMKRAVFDCRDNPQLPVVYIRVRDEGGGVVTFSAKDYPDNEKGYAHQRELMVNVDNFENTVNLLKIIGLKQTNYQETKRETWKFGNSEICIDIWPGLKPYIEIESTSLDEIAEIATRLPIGSSKRYNGGLIEVYMDEYGWDTDTVKKNVVLLTFEHMSFRPK